MFLICSLNNESAEKIANLIVADFPTEVSSTYYVPPIKKKHSLIQRSIPARGKLVNAWRNRTLASRKFDNAMEMIQSTVDYSDKNGKITQNKFTFPTFSLYVHFCCSLILSYFFIEPFIHISLHSTDDPEIQDSIQWLHNNQMPWELVLQHWHKTFNLRRENIDKSKENTLFDILTTWPILKHPHGYSLIIEDFKHMVLSEETLTMNKWDTFFHHITNLINSSQRDDDLHLLMETLQDTNINEGKLF